MFISHSIYDAQTASPMGATVPLFALGLQGNTFTKGEMVPLGTGKVMLFNTGVSINSWDNNVLGLITTKLNPKYLGLTIVGGSIVINNNDTKVIMLPLINYSGTVLIEYGQHIADLHFLKTL